VYRHRIAVTGAILAIAVMGCGASHAKDNVAAVQPTAATAPSTTTTVAPSTTATTAPPGTTPVTQGPARHVTTTTQPPAAPEPASITVKYTPHDGGTATATLEETGETQSLADGSAVFGDLPAGTYTVHVTTVFPGDSGQVINRSRPIALQAGDHAVVTCDDNGCTGIA